MTRHLFLLLHRAGRSYPLYRGLLWLAQLCLFVAAGCIAFLLRFDFVIPAVHARHLRIAIPIWLVAKSISFRLLGLERGWWRYGSARDVLRIGAGNLVGSILAAIAIFQLAPPGFPRSVYILDLLICFVLTCGVRLGVRLVFEASHKVRRDCPDRRILVYGAGAAGHALVREIRGDDNLHYQVVGFVDDNPSKRHARFQGVRVLGSGSELPLLAATQGIEEILIAIPSANGAQMISILDSCRRSGVPCKTVPRMADLISNRALASQIREVAVEDLLGRKPVRLDEERIRAKIAGKVVLVTGASGSIGSELCRQIARFNPGTLVAFEISETGLFYLDRELRRSHPELRFFSELGSIRDVRRLSEIFETPRPEIIYHAAAYKHVPLMESHLFEAVENNIFGTYNLADAARQFEAADLVMISSDKAVRPVNVMGVTKRVAELMINSFQNGGPKFVSVRFGNVLGSSGSVLPLFREQISAGGPVTVTHPDMRRFFMTIPEAVQLVLQASTMGSGGEVFVLDMGEPVKIADLARNLILLSGLDPEKIKIEFTGVRPGEKLYEELSGIEENTLPTCHQKIKVFLSAGVTPAEMERFLAVLRSACRYRDSRELIFCLKDIVPDYNPSTHILRLIADAPKPAARVAMAPDG